MKQGLRRIILPLLVILVPTLLSWFIYTQSTPLSKGEHAAPEISTTQQRSYQFPQKIEELRQTSFTQGEEALSEINKLHQGNIEAKNGYVLVYSDQSYGARIWISESEKDAEAQNATEQMTNKLQNTSMFAPPQPTNISGRKIFVTSGAGTKDYYYQNRTWVIWISTDLPDDRASTFLEAAISTLNPD